MMKNIHTLISILVILSLSSPVLAKESRDDKQAGLDQACELEREKKLAPIRNGFIEECVANKEQPSQLECETFYADYGGRMGGRAALFYDLPQCVEAFDYQQSARSGGA
jgi:hypothetical protein